MVLMIKKLTAFLCVTMLMLSMLVPTTIVSAAPVRDCWKDVKPTESLYFENGDLVFDGTGGASPTWMYQRLFAYDVTLKFTAKIDVNGTLGVQLYNGGTRTGFYLHTGGMNIFGQGNTGYSIGTDWHEYKIEVIDNVQTIYVDGQVAAVKPGEKQNTETSLRFWTNPGGKFRVGYWELQSHDGSKPRIKTANYGGEWLPGEDYTPGFTQDWKTDTGNWYITDDPAVEWDKEAGVIRFDGSKSFNGNYVPVQHALNLAPAFDWKWKMKIIRNVKFRIQIKFYGDMLNFYFYVNENELLRGGQYGTKLKDGTYNSKSLAIPVQMGENYGDWCDMELQRRGEYLTLFVDGGKTKTWRAYQGGSEMGMIGWAVEASGLGNMSSDMFEIGETQYIPYFPTVEMKEPLYKSEFAEGTDIELRAEAEGETEYIDYFVDDVKVGRGYAPDYTYVLKNAKVGTYNVSAGVGDERSVATVMTVRPAFTAELNISSEEVKYGEAVEVGISTDAFSEAADAASVEYYVDGKLAATSNQKPFTAKLDKLKVGTSSVYAKVKNKQDVIQTTEIKTIDVYTDGKSAVDFEREYDITYKYNGGTGKVEVEDGYFKLCVENDGNVLKYLDRDNGMQEYSMTRFKDSVTGIGDYRIITTAGFAEVYYNGQMLHSFYMPRTENKNKISYSGIEGFRMTGRGSKYTLFTEEWKGDADYASTAINMGTIEPLDSLNVFSAFEFDKTDLSDEVVTFYDGRYQTKLIFRDGKLYGRDQGKLGGKIKEEFELERTPEVGYYRVNITEGAATVWCNNNYVGSFTCPLYAHKAQIVRQMTNPSASTIVAVKTVDDIYYHSEDFSGDKELVAYDYWIKNGDISAKINKDETTGKYHTTINSPTEGRFYLNGYTKDINFKAKVKVDNGKDFYMMTRMHPIYYDFKLGYDFENSCYYAEYDVFGGNSKGYGSERRTFPGTFETGVWHDIEVINKERQLVMKVDGKTVIDTSDLWLVLAGNAGFGIVGGTMNFTDVYYEGRGKIGSGVNGVHNNEGTSYNDFVQMKDGRVVSFSGRGGTRYTSDKGKTWTAPEGGATSNGNILVTKDGNWVRISATSSKPTAAISTDDGATWGNAIPIPVVNHQTSNLIIQNNFSTVAKNGRLLVTTDEGLTENSGKVGVYWSDDGGKTWSESETFFEETVNGINTQEASFVDMPEEGHYRIFFRTDRNFLYMADSWDDCKTFDQARMIPSPFRSTCTTFKIRRDINEDQTYYALWTYEMENSWQGTRNEPRNSVALAVSYDGMKSWEYVQTIFDTSDYPNGLVRNYSLEIIDDTIYISMNGQALDCFLMAIDKNKIKTTKRFEEAHPRGAWYNTTADEEAYSFNVIPNQSGQAWIFGNYEDIEVRDGGFVKAETLAKVFRSTIEKNGNEATFRIGDGYVKFTDGASSYDVNGAVTDFGSMVMKDGFININACAKAFGKTITENKAKNGWVIWPDAVYNDYFREQLEGLI